MVAISSTPYVPLGTAFLAGLGSLAHDAVVVFPHRHLLLDTPWVVLILPYLLRDFSCFSSRCVPSGLHHDPTCCDGQLIVEDDANALDTHTNITFLDDLDNPRATSCYGDGAQRDAPLRDIRHRAADLPLVILPPADATLPCGTLNTEYSPLHAARLLWPGLPVLMPEFGVKRRMPLQRSMP